MKFSVKVKAIASQIAYISNICNPVNPNNPDDLTQYIFFKVFKDHIDIAGTNYQVQLSTKINLEQAADTEGSFLFLSVKAREFFKNLNPEDTVTFELDDSQPILKLSVPNNEFSLRIRRLGIQEEFPLFNVEQAGAQQSIVVEQRVLKHMLDKSIFCVAPANASYKEYLQGVRFEANGDNLSVLAIDGHRLAVMDAKLANPVAEPVAQSLVIRGVNELNKLLINEKGQTVELKFNSAYFDADVNGFQLRANLLKCKYPNVRAVLPSSLDHEVCVDTALFKESVYRVALCSNKRLNSINLTFKDNALRFYAENNEHETAMASVGISFNAESAIETNLNADFLKAFVNAIDTPQLKLGLFNPYSTTLIMPRYQNDSEYSELGVKARYLVSHIIV